MVLALSSVQQARNVDELHRLENACANNPRMERERGFPAGKVCAQGWLQPRARPAEKETRDIANLANAS